MRWLRAIGGELWSLFVDDLRLAILTLGWIGGVGLLVREFPGGELARSLAAVALFCGIAAILLASARRAARRAPLSQSERRRSS